MARIALPVVLGVALAVLTGCDRGTHIEGQEYTVACGMCILKSEPRGCYWAARVGDEVLPVIGPGVPLDHDAHGPGGMCTMERRAVIDGTLHAERIIADRFELLPADRLVEAPPHDHAH